MAGDERRSECLPPATSTAECWLWVPCPIYKNECMRSRSLTSSGEVTCEDDTALIAGQLADLTRVVKGMTDQLAAVREAADTQEGRAAEQQDRIDRAARELDEVSTRLQTAADALRTSV